MKSILNNYAIEALKWFFADRGISNQNVFIQSKDGGEYILKIFRSGIKSIQDIELEIEFTEYLNKLGLQTIDLVSEDQTGKKYLFYSLENQEWIVILMPKAKGDHVHWDQIDEYLLQDIARTHAKMHLYGEEFYNLKKISEKQTPPLEQDENVNLDILKFGLGRTVYELGLDEYEVDSEIIDKHIKEAKSFQLTYPINLSVGYIHGDFDENNFLIYDNKVSCVLDWDDLRIEPIATCLSIILFTILKYSTQDYFDKYLKYYSEIRNISEDELYWTYKAMLLTGYFYILLEVKLKKPIEEILNNINKIDKVKQLVQQFKQ